jgi:hypothetical protein
MAALSGRMSPRVSLALMRSPATPRPPLRMAWRDAALLWSAGLSRRGAMRSCGERLRVGGDGCGRVPESRSGGVERLCFHARYRDCVLDAALLLSALSDAALLGGGTVAANGPLCVLCPVLGSMCRAWCRMVWQSS